MPPWAETSNRFSSEHHGNDEGDADDEEFRVAAVKDRVDTTMQVWMGLTAGCAKCHSHKYDRSTKKNIISSIHFLIKRLTQIVVNR